MEKQAFGKSQHISMSKSLKKIKTGHPHYSEGYSQNLKGDLIHHDS